MTVIKERTPTTCRICRADLKGDPIPEEYKWLYGGHQTHYSLAERVMGDTLKHYPLPALIGYRCPKCKLVFPADAPPFSVDRPRSGVVSTPLSRRASGPEPDTPGA